MQNDPVIPAFPDLHLSPTAILKELSNYFKMCSSQSRLLTLLSPHDPQSREAQEYPCTFINITGSRFGKHSLENTFINITDQNAIWEAEAQDS